MFKSLCAVALFGGAMVFFAGCDTNPPNTETKRQVMSDEVKAAMTQMKAKDPSLNDLLSRSYAYVIFPTVGKGGFIAGGAFGKGEVYEHGELVGYSSLQQGTVGLQAGGQEYAELIVFQTRESLQKFQAGNYTFAGNISAVALKAGAGGGTQFDNGIAVITMPKGGLMFEASVGGQKFTYTPVGGVPATQPSNP